MRTTLASSPTTTLRVKAGTHRALKRLAERTGLSLTEYLDRLATEAEDKAFWDSVDDAYRRLRDDPKAWSQEVAERSLLDNTAADGLKEPY